MATRCAARSFACSDPEQAAAYFSAPPTADAHGDLLSRSFRQTILNMDDQRSPVPDPVATAAYLDSLPSDQVRYLELTTVAKHWAEQDPAAALNWATRFSDPQQHDGAVQGIVDSWSQTDPQSRRPLRVEHPQRFRSGNARADTRPELG